MDLVPWKHPFYLPFLLSFAQAFFLVPKKRGWSQTVGFAMNSSSAQWRTVPRGGQGRRDMARKHMYV